MSDYDDAIAENEPFLSEQGATSEAGAGGSSSGSAAASTAAGKGAASGLGAAAGGAAPSLAAVAAVGVMTVAVGIMVAVALSTSHSPHDSGVRAPPAQRPLRHPRHYLSCFPIFGRDAPRGELCAPAAALCAVR